MFMVSVHNKEKSPMEIHRALLRQNVAEKRRNQSETDKKKGIYLVKTISSFDRSVLSAWPERRAALPVWANEAMPESTPDTASDPQTMPESTPETASDPESVLDSEQEMMPDTATDPETIPESTPATTLDPETIPESAPKAPADSTPEAHAQDINLYALDSTQAGFVQIPQNLATSFQLPAGTYSFVSPNSWNPNVEISSTGLVKPKGTVWYWSGIFWTSGPITGATKTRTQYETGRTTVRVTQNDGSTQDFTFNVLNYADDVYAPQRLEELIKEYIPAGATPYQVLEGACKLAASFDYSGKASDWKSMILVGSGDCWASSYRIQKVCEDYGIEARVRNANRDPGALSGYRNVIAKIEDRYFVADAGYDGKAPRHYSILPSDGYFYLFDRSTQTNTLYQYDAIDTDVKIPTERNGHPVTALGERVFDKRINTVHIPASIQTITSIHTTDQGVRSGTFSYAEGLQNIYVDPANANYKDIDSVLYSKDGKTLVQFPAGRSGSCTIPAGVTAIGPGAFYSTHLTRLELPASMASIGDYAFASTSIQSLHFEGDRLSFGKGTFSQSQVTFRCDKDWGGLAGIDFGDHASVKYRSTATKGNLADAQIDSIPAQTYTGQPLTLQPVVRLDGQELTLNVDYTLSYSNNIEAGTATVTVTGIGYYEGSKNATFTIRTNGTSRPATKRIMYRLYNPNSGEHFYTAGTREQNYLLSVGWKDEGIGWIAPLSSQHPVYRLYNANTGDHHCTMDARERDQLIKFGWKDEGIG